MVLGLIMSEEESAKARAAGAQCLAARQVFCVPNGGAWASLEAALLGFGCRVLAVRLSWGCSLQSCHLPAALGAWQGCHKLGIETRGAQRALCSWISWEWVNCAFPRGAARLQSGAEGWHRMQNRAGYGQALWLCPVQGCQKDTVGFPASCGPLCHIPMRERGQALG